MGTAPHPRSFSGRLTVMNLLVSGIALLIAGLAFAVYDLVTFRSLLLRNLSAEAQMVASNSVTALLFNDPATAEETLRALRASREVVIAELYAADGRLFASYVRDGASAQIVAPRIPAGAMEASAFDAESADVARRVMSDGAPVGTVRIRADLQALYARLARYALIVVAVLIVSLAGALVVSRVAQRVISAPLVELAAVARRVSQERDYGVRAGGDATSSELAVLVDSFNVMLAEIQLRDRSLEEARAQLESRVEERTAELNATNHELEAFTYSVSHDLRAPLRHITGFASLLEEQAGPSLDEQGRRYLKTITDAAGRMATLIDDLLAFSRTGRASLTKRRVDLNALTTEARGEVSVDLDGRRIVWDVHPLPDVNADPALLRPVMVNLLSNALKYTRPRDEARIEVGTCAGRPGEVAIYVRDNGVGFDMAYAHKLFGVFQRLHRADEFTGTGIGLANVRRIVQRHGGRTWAEGVVGEGATFYFSLPAKESLHDG